jgi:hypothetical protein
MTLNSLKFEGRLDGGSNFLSWKVRVTLLLEENDLCEIIKNVATCCCLYTHLGNVEEIFNPLSVSLGASLESRCCHLILDSSV